MSTIMRQVLSADNLNAAYLRIVRNKGAAGIDGMKYTELKAHLIKNGEIIRQQLKNGKYTPYPVRRVDIPKSGGGKRKIGIPTVTDRFIQQALTQVLAPVFEKQFHEHSYGYRQNHSAQQAVVKALQMINNGNTWVVDIDIAEFFDSVNHEKLINVLRKTIDDKTVISIVRKMLASGVIVDGKFTPSANGIPQGGNISPLLANVFLDELDKEMHMQNLDFVRYADDCIIMVDNREKAENVKREISEFIEKELGLKINEGKSQISRPSGIKYLGFGFYYDYKKREYRAKPHRESMAKFKIEVDEIISQGQEMNFKDEHYRLMQLIRGWGNYYGICDMEKIYRRLICITIHRKLMNRWRRYKSQYQRDKRYIQFIKGSDYCRRSYIEVPAEKSVFGF